ncbi:MAG: PA14 domain-containing protein, partial [bacterium]|nr:PA14 domain-containing protein [bacterium]
FTFLLFRELFTPREGVLAALMLAVSAWHIHFSRIAFELISFPCLFTLGLFLLYRGATRRTACLFPGAAVMGLALYTYGTARVFVPLFLLGFAVLYARDLLRRRWAALAALLVFAAAAYPMARFGMRHPSAAKARFDQISIFSLGKPANENLRLFARNYARHFSYDFLFRRGDPMARHAVPWFGQLYRADIPLYLLGLVLCLVKYRREGALLVWWLALFPVAAALTVEVPSATRAIAALPILPGIAAVGMGFIFSRFLADRRLVLRAAGGAAIVAYLAYFVPEFGEYVRAYYLRYPAFSAEGIYGFQYGYREMIRFMQSRRDEYDRLVVTSRDANMPNIFIRFYTAGEDDVRRGFPPKFQVFRAEEYGRYSPGERILFALRPDELVYFSSYDVERRIVAPNGREAFVVAHVKARKQYLTDWMALGLFDNRGGRGERRDNVDIASLDPAGAYEGLGGTVRWRRPGRAFVNIDLNAFFRNDDPDHPGNPEDVCAYALTYLVSPDTRGALLEVTATEERGAMWLNREPLSKGVVTLGRRPSVFRAALREGINELVLKLCERGGEWAFAVRLTGLDGAEMPDVFSTVDAGSRGPFEPVTPAAAERAPPLEPPPRGEGLRAEYFEGTEPSGPPALVAVDPVPAIDFLDDAEKPLPPPFSARWEGYISIPEDGLYMFATESDDGSRLFIGETLAVNNWREQAATRRSGFIRMEGGLHPIRIEYFDARWKAYLRVYWTPPGQSEEVIPARLFSH